MNHESNVYGYIQYDQRSANSECNQTCVANLPTEPDDRLLWRGMFNISTRTDTGSGLIHFAACYDGIEYEWEHWLSQFQQLLQRMRWENATVHLETLFSGNHTFNWENEEGLTTESSLGKVRCEWTRESSFQ